MDILSKLQKYTDYSLGISKEKLEIKYEDTRFDNLNFLGFDLNNTFFLEVEFIKCDFSGVYLSGSNLSGSAFENCIFNKNVFRKGQADYTVFNATNISELDSLRTSFYGSDFKNLIIENSKMIRNSIFRANISNVIFKNVDLTETYFNHTKFENVKFINCILNDENLWKLKD